MKHKLFYILIILCVLLIVKAIMPKPLVVKYYEEYTVQAGDGLESIAKKYPHKDQLGQFEYIIKDTNGIEDSKVYAGETILIPIIEQ